MIGKNKTNSDVITEYREVSGKLAIYTTLILVVVVALSLGWLNQKIAVKGSEITDVSRYQNLLADMDGDVKMIQRILESEHIEEIEFAGGTALGDTLIKSNNTEAGESQNTLDFDVKLNGIYWSPRDPIATINGENCHIGDLVQGCRIVEIRKTEVVFEDPMGGEVVKYFYDYLD